MPDSLEYIVEDAHIYCTEGTLIDQFKATNNPYYVISLKNVAVEEDNEIGIHFPINFGTCEVKGKEKCVPDIADWEGAVSDQKANHMNVLVYKCTAQCSKGGEVKFATSGQDGKGGGIDKVKLPDETYISNPNGSYPPAVKVEVTPDELIKRRENNISMLRESQESKFYKAPEIAAEGITDFFNIEDGSTLDNVVEGVVTVVTDVGIGAIPIVGPAYSIGALMDGVTEDIEKGNKEGALYNGITYVGGLFLGKMAGKTARGISVERNYPKYSNKATRSYYNKINKAEKVAEKVWDAGYTGVTDLTDFGDINVSLDMVRADFGSKAACKAAVEVLSAESDGLGKKVSSCFPAGTLISVEKGFKLIEDIQVGDKVWSKNEITGEITLKKVLKLLKRETESLIELTLEDEIIETTPSHPFYTEEGWKKAEDLTLEDKLITQDNKWYRIKNKRFIYSQKKVYNFEVEDYHTYFVSKDKYLVHNACERPIEGPLPPAGFGE